MASWLDTLRSGAWLTRERMRLVALAVLTASLIGAGFLIVTAHGRNDSFGRPLGTDFSNVYAAGSYVLAGKAAAPYDPPRQYAREQAIFGQKTQFYGWHYPPFFLGLATLLATMPYRLALALYQGATLLLYLLTIRAVLSASPSPAGRGSRAGGARDGVSGAKNDSPPPAGPPLAIPDQIGSRLSPLQGEVKKAWLLFALAYPAVFINLGHGNNGFLTTALLGAALALINPRPWLAGVLIGLLAYKPQFGLLIPLVLIVSGNWRAFIAATVTVLVLAFAVTLAFGPAIWAAFLASTHFTRTVVLEQGGTGWYKIQSVFSVVRMWGGSVDLAYAVQTVVTLIVAAALAWLWHSRAAYSLKAAALLIGSILATPYSLDYDLMLLAPAIAFLAVDGFKHGFAPWEKSLLALLWIVPLFTRAVAEATLIPLGVPAMLLAFGFLLHRAIRETGRAQVHGILRSAP